ncbi:Aldo-keto reductase family 1 member A1-A [Dirofilaria immitis]
MVLVRAACYIYVQEVGKVLDEEFIRPDKLKREDVFVTTKCTRNRAKEVDEQLCQLLEKLRATCGFHEMKHPDTSDSLEKLWTISPMLLSFS